MSDKWDQAVKKLTELTESGQLKWRAVLELAGVRDKTVNIIGPIYRCERNGKRIVVYQAQAYKWVDQYEDMMPHDPAVVIEFVNQFDQTEFTWPGPYGRWQLLEAIQQQVSNVDEFLEDLLAS